MPTSNWIRRYHAVPAAPAVPAARLRLLCLPHAGGSASYYFPVSAALHPDIEVLAVQYPGRQDRLAEPRLESIAELADAITGELGEETGLPLALFGHSMGATLAFEVARRLEARGVAPVELFASGRRAPSRHRPETVHLRDDAGVLAELRRLDGTSPVMLEDEELVRMFLPALRSDYTAIENYRPAPGASVACPVTVLVGEDDPKTTMDEARAWEGHTTGPFTLRVFPGGHFYLTEHSAAVISVISHTLGQRVR